jgi:hypothetical protein
LQYNLEAMKQVFEAVTSPNIRCDSLCLESAEFVLSVHKFKIIIHKIRYCGWKIRGYRNSVVGKTELVSNAFCVLVLHLFEGLYSFHFQNK